MTELPIITPEQIENDGTCPEHLYTDGESKKILFITTARQKRQIQAMAGAKGLTMTAFLKMLVRDAWNAHVREVNVTITTLPIESAEVEFSVPQEGDYDSNI